jgi:predicted RNA methylase
VDVVLCEMMHVALVEEQQIPVLNSVRKHLEERYPGHPFAVIPQAAVNYVQLVQNNWDYYGFKAPFPRMGSAYANDPYALPLSQPTPYLTVDFNQPGPEHIAAMANVEVTGYGNANAVRLTTQTILNYDESKPEAERMLDWYMHFLVLPLPTEQEVEPRNRFIASLEYDAGCPTDAIAMEVKPA